MIEKDRGASFPGLILGGHMAKRIKTAVIAGTPVDTQMGIDFLERKNAEASGGAATFEFHCCPASEDCDAQIRFQYFDDDSKRAVIDNIFDPEIEDGTKDFFVYCNSLSGAFDFDTYAVGKSAETGADIRIYTPLQVYRKLGADFGRVGVIAANNISTHGIEEALMAANPDIYVIGTGNMAIVRAIEDGLSPGEIVDSHGLEELLAYMEACGAEAVILGCTHFPFLKEELEALTDLPLIDPAEEMYRSLADALRRDR